MSDLTMEQWLEVEFQRRLADGVSPASAYFGAGYMAMIEEQPERAILAFEKAISFDCSNALYRHMLGLIYADSGNNLQAVELFKKAIDLKCSGLTLEIPEENPYFHLAWALEDLGRLDEAERAYRDSIGHAPAHYNSHFRLARLLHKRGMFKKAEEVYLFAIKIFGKHFPKILQRIIFKDMEFNLQRAIRHEIYEEYQPNSEEKLIDAQLMSQKNHPDINPPQFR